jgi:hypothetical protein
MQPQGLNGTHQRVDGIIPFPPDQDPAPDPPPATGVNVIIPGTRAPAEVLRAALLRGARWLLGHSTPYVGAPTITVRAADGSTALTIKPTPGEQANPIDPFVVRCPAAFFSPDERRIVLQVAPGPTPSRRSFRSVSLSGSGVPPFAGT